MQFLMRGNLGQPELIDENPVLVGGHTVCPGLPVGGVGGRDGLVQVARVLIQRNIVAKGVQLGLQLKWGEKPMVKWPEFRSFSFYCLVLVDVRDPVGAAEHFLDLIGVLQHVTQIVL